MLFDSTYPSLNPSFNPVLGLNTAYQKMPCSFCECRHFPDNSKITHEKTFKSLVFVIGSTLLLVMVPWPLIMVPWPLIIRLSFTLCLLRYRVIIESFKKNAPVDSMAN